MRVILKNIPTDTEPKELSKYIQPSLGNGIFNLFKTPGKISKINILAQKDPESNIVKHHGLTTIEPDNAAKRCIKRLNRTSFNGKIIFVREFFNRSSKNDRRHSAKAIKLPRNRRSTDRRIHILEEITHFGISFSNRQQFSRKLGG